MNAKKLPSGSWRARVYSYTDGSGTRHYESFTAPTQAEAEMLATQFKAKANRKERAKLTVKQAIDGYINAKRKVLSPSTCRAYEQMARMRYDRIANKRVDRLTSEDVQIWISDMSGEVSPKTVRNVYSLLRASIALYSPDKVFRVTLPAKEVKRSVSPSDDVIRALYQNADDKLKRVLILAILGMRRGEIAALKFSDIKDHVAHVHADIVRDPDGEWIYKEIPKTADSDRYVRLPDDFPDGDGYVVGWLPDTITKRFIEHRNRLGLDLRLHDLRHYFASSAKVIGIPDIYTADMGGWKRDGSVMKAIYQNNIESISEYYAKKMVDHVNKVII